MNAWDIVIRHQHALVGWDEKRIDYEEAYESIYELVNTLEPILRLLRRGKKIAARLQALIDSGPGGEDGELAEWMKDVKRWIP